MSNPSVVVAEVVLPLPLDQAYSYRVPDDLTDGAVAGARVLVPFGPRRLTGLVTALRETDAEEGAALKPILDVLDETPSFTKEMLRLTKWMADYYVCGWGEVVKAALPTGTDVATEHRLARTDAPAAVIAAHDRDHLDRRDAERERTALRLGHVVSGSIVLEEVAASGAAMNGCSALHTSIFGMNPVVKHGTAAMQERYLPRVADGSLRESHRDQ